MAEAFLILVNALLAIRTLANLTAILIDDPDELILEYNAHLLFGPTFRLTTILVNLLIFLTSLLSLMAILFTRGPKQQQHQYGHEYQMKRHKLLKYTTISQLILAFGVLILMGKVWFCPPKLELDQADFGSFVDNYDYHHYHLRFRQPGLLVAETDRYENPYDRLQQSLGCCGYRSPSEWTDTSTRRRRQPNLSLLAPSCCSSPHSAILTPNNQDDSDADRPTLTSPSTDKILMGAMSTNGKLIHYCASLDTATMRIDSNGLEIPAGCRQRLAERDPRFLFALRMRLLLLLASLFLMTQAALTFYLPSITAATASSTSPTSTPARGGGGGGDSNHPSGNGYGADDSRRGQQRRGRRASNNVNRVDHLPPDYWHALAGACNPANVVVLVDKVAPGGGGGGNNNNNDIRESQIDCQLSSQQTVGVETSRPAAAVVVNC